MKKLFLCLLTALSVLIGVSAEAARRQDVEMLVERMKGMDAKRVSSEHGAYTEIELNVGGVRHVVTFASFASLRPENRWIRIVIRSSSALCKDFLDVGLDGQLDVATNATWDSDVPIDERGQCASASARSVSFSSGAGRSRMGVQNQDHEQSAYDETIRRLLGSNQ